MESLRVECLRCGAPRIAGRRDPGECPRCGYVGWAPSRELSERARRELREHPVERRTLRAA